MSTYVDVVISPATTTSPVVISVSQATRPAGSSVRTASRTESEIWSATLSGCPSVTDSDVNDQLAAAAVAPARVPARHHQVAHACEPGERVHLRAELLAEPGHLDEAARHDRRLRVVAEPEPVDGARGERDHVLRRGTELDADQ